MRWHMQSEPCTTTPSYLKLITEASELAGESPWLFQNPNGDGPIDTHAPTRALTRALWSFDRVKT